MLKFDSFFEEVGFLKSFFEKTEYVFEIFDFMEVIFKSIKFQISPKAFIANEAVLENKEFIFVDDGAVIEPFAYVKGPCYIGKGVIIRHGSYVRNGCIFLEKALVGHGCEIKRSIFLKEARAAHFNYVGDSVLGGGVNLGAGAILSNMRLDKKNIKVKIEGAVIEGPHKLGAIVGDGCQIGCNAVLNPGTFLMKGSCCYPNCTLSGVIEENSVYRS